MSEYIDRQIADVCTVVRGKWIEDADPWGDTYYICSHCRERWVSIEGTPAENNMNFCPFCGRDMRGLSDATL